VAKITVNETCNVYTGAQTKDPRNRVEITVPSLRLRLNLFEARELAVRFQQAVEVAEREIKAVAHA